LGLALFPAGRETGMRDGANRAFRPAKLKQMKDARGEDSGGAQGCAAEIGDRVRFAVADVFLPGPGSGPIAACDETEIYGTVIEFSDSGSKPRAFAVVEVVRTQMMVVPVNKLHSVAGGPEDPAISVEKQ
jgi:hypothetical protein